MERTRGRGHMTGFELVVGYLAAWSLGKTRKAGLLLDSEADRALDLALERLHNVVTSRVGNDPAVKKLQSQAASRGRTSQRVREQVEKALRNAADKDPDFRRSLLSALDQLREADNRMNISIKGPQVGNNNFQINNF